MSDYREISVHVGSEAARPPKVPFKTPPSSSFLTFSLGSLAKTKYKILKINKMVLAAFSLKKEAETKKNPKSLFLCVRFVLLFSW